MKKNLLKLSAILLAFISFAKTSSAQNFVYFRESFSGSAWPSTAAASLVGLGTGIYIYPSSGTWYTYGSYSTNGATGACTTQTNDVQHLRTGNLTSITNANDSAYFVTPVTNFGVNTLTFFNGRASRRFTISKTTDTAATTTNWTTVFVAPATNAACDQITVTVNDVTTKRIRIMARGGTDSDLDSLVMTSVNAIAPVKFGGINISQNNGLVRLNWDVLVEINTLKYVIERSVNGVDFVPAGALSAINASKYTYVDNAPLSVANAYYRIKSIDKDGLVCYSNIVKLSTKKQDANIVVSPNPVKDGRINLQLNSFSKGTYNVLVYDAAGRQVYAKQTNVEEGTSSQVIELSSGVQKGIYQLQVVNGTSRLTKSVVIQ